MKFTENQSLKSLNSFGLDTKSHWYTEAVDVDSLRSILTDSRYKSTRKMILGGGSNVLFKCDFDGLIIHNKIGGIDIIEENKIDVLVRSGAGIVWNDLVQFCIQKNFPGLENLSLIPGSVGAAPIQNIGAYGVEIKSTFDSLNAVNMEDGSVQTFTNSECRFGYRDSIFKKEAKNKFAIVDVSFRLNKKSQLNTSYGAINDQLKVMNVLNPTIRDISNAVIAIRQSKLPDPKVIGNAGSFFKNPEIPVAHFEELKKTYSEIVGYPTAGGNIKLAAGWLIEKAGWKGKRIGNVGMHEKQALVLVNYGSASGEELISHALRVQQSVKEKFGVNIEMEVNIIE